MNAIALKDEPMTDARADAARAWGEYERLVAMAETHSLPTDSPTIEEAFVRFFMACVRASS